MNINEQNSIVKIHSGLERVNKQVTIANKLLQNLTIPLIPYRKKDKWGFCTPQKRIVIECIYDHVCEFGKPYARVSKEGKWGVIDKIGHVVIGFEYEAMGFHTEGLLPVKKNGSWGFIDKHGNIAIDFTYESVHEGFFNGIARVIKHGNLLEIDKNNQIKKVIEKRSDRAFPIRLRHLELMFPRRGTYISLSVSEKTEGLIVTEKNGKYGFQNEQGEQIIEEIYDEVEEFLNGIARVYIHKRWEYIDKNGTQFWED